MRTFRITLLAAFLFAANTLWAQRFLGGDISLLPSYEKAATQYRTEKGKVKPALQLFKEDGGWNSARVRIFVDPSNARAESKDEGVCQDLPYVTELCKQIKQSGMSLMLDFHYSDTWADPAHQTTPKAWLQADIAALGDSVYQYTRKVLEALKEEGAAPDMIQVGNEITNGMLWPTGHVDPTQDDIRWSVLASFLRQGVKACREVCPKAKIIIHTERAGDWDVTKSYYESLLNHGVDYDIVGLSYYPMWHKDIPNLSRTLDSLDVHFPNKEVMIVETAFYYSHENDRWVTDKQQHSDLYPITPEGQAQFTRELVTMLNGHDNVTGLYWWFAEENESGKPVMDSWLNRGLFDNHTGRALPAFYELEKFGDKGR